VIAASIVALLLFLLMLRIPVAFAIFVAGAVGLWWIGDLRIMWGTLQSTVFTVASYYEFIVIPMFLLMAELIVVSGIANDLFKAAAAWVGRLPGGLAVATALAGAGFGAISGSSTACAAVLSASSVPAMLREGYEPRLAYGAVAISGTLAMLIPPSVALVLFGLVADVSISDLLIGGVIPGLLVVVTIVLTVMAIVVLDPRKAPRLSHYSKADRIKAVQIAFPMTFLFFCVIVTIYTGIATPTEASALGALGALIVGICRRKLTARLVLRAAYRATITSCMVMLIVIAANGFAVFFALTNSTQLVVTWVGGLDISPTLVLCVIYLVYIILGCFLDLTAILILTVPFVVPLVVSLGYDPVWFGVVAVVLGELGMVTPPVGLNVFVVAQTARVPAREIFIGVTPHIIAHLFVVAILTAWPQIVLWLPQTMSH